MFAALSASDLRDLNDSPLCSTPLDSASSPLTALQLLDPLIQLDPPLDCTSTSARLEKVPSSQKCLFVAEEMERVCEWETATATTTTATATHHQQQGRPKLAIDE